MSAKFRCIIDEQHTNRNDVAWKKLISLQFYPTLVAVTLYRVWNHWHHPEFGRGSGALKRYQTLFRKAQSNSPAIRPCTQMRQTWRGRTCTGTSRRLQIMKQSRVPSAMRKRVAPHDPLLGIQPHKVMCGTDAFQMPSPTTREACDTGKGWSSRSWWWNGKDSESQHWSHDRPLNLVLPWLGLRPGAVAETCEACLSWIPGLNLPTHISLLLSMPQRKWRLTYP